MVSPIDNKSPDSNPEYDINEEELAILEQLLREENPQSLEEIANLGLEKIDTIVENDELEEAVTRDTSWSGYLNRLRVGLFHLRMKAQNHMVNLYYASLRLLKTSLTQTWLAIKNFAADWNYRFKALSLTKKILYLVLTLLSVTAPYLVYLTKSKLDKTDTLSVITDLSLYADRSIPLELQRGFDDFFRTRRKPPNLFLIKRIIANLKSDNPVKKPMLAAEILVEAPNPQVLVQIKKHEGRFKDFIISFTQSWSYEQLETPQGKRDYLTQLKEELQKQVTAGQISRLYFKTIVLKPE